MNPIKQKATELAKTISEKASRCAVTAAEAVISRFTPKEDGARKASLVKDHVGDAMLCLYTAAGSRVDIPFNMEPTQVDDESGGVRVRFSTDIEAVLKDKMVLATWTFPL